LLFIPISIDFLEVLTYPSASYNPFIKEAKILLEEVNILDGIKESLAFLISLNSY